MAKFLITYHGSGMPSDPAAMEQAKAAFGKWLAEAGNAIVDPGAPVKMVKQVSSGAPTQMIEIGGYSIIEAQNVDEAEKVLKSHPFVARGGTLQINELISI